ncbi:hypothetical protein LZ30DRAFT_723492 [Colletotrichum cereale]|nr:hypothetical protein LZ30DRAFT_723492 [Colletotrichum cereale]
MNCVVSCAVTCTFHPVLCLHLTLPVFAYLPRYLPAHSCTKPVAPSLLLSYTTSSSKRLLPLFKSCCHWTLDSSRIIPQAGCCCPPLLLLPLG